MTVTNPEWLTQRGGVLRPSKDGKSYLVYFDGNLQYSLVPIPASGKYTCRISQTINGKSFNSQGTYATLEEAIQAGSESLRAALGW